MNVEIDTIVSMPFEENTFVVHLAGRTDCLIVDPGLQPRDIVEHCDRAGLEPAAILITHGHSDHIGGLRGMKQRWPDCPVIIGLNDAAKLTDPRLNLSQMYGMPLRFAPADRTVVDNETIEAAGMRMTVRELPGHSAGHVVFILADETPKIVLVGDVIFSGGIGRSDFPDGNHEQLLDGIRQKLFTLPDDTVLMPGHGPNTTVGQERATNPFLVD